MPKMRGTDDDKTHRVSEGGLSAPPAPAFRVVVQGEGSSALVDGSAELLVGQSPACALRVSDPMASRRHLSFDLLPTGDLHVVDLGSTNGTFIGALRVGEAWLRGGEVVRIGGTSLTVHAERRESAPEVHDTSFGRLLGQSRAIRRLFPLLQKLAASSIPVLIEGETGTGKEVAARAIHEASPRKAAPLIVFDCTTASASVIESELFGHERGAFTGAQSTRKGVFEQAQKGTLFIDELGDLPLDLQGKLLRAIERSEVRRVGGNDWIHCDVRIVAATRRNLEELVQRGLFRDDLFHRLAIGRVSLPNLRSRREDIRPLALHFAAEADKDAAPIPERLLLEWQSQPWPGNVRELRNAVYRYVTLGELGELDFGEADEHASDLATVVPSVTPSVPSMDNGEVPQTDTDILSVVRLCLPYPQARDRIQRDFERTYVRYMLELSKGNVGRAAQASGIALRYFQHLRTRSGA